MVTRTFKARDRPPISLLAISILWGVSDDANSSLIADTIAQYRSPGTPTSSVRRAKTGDKSQAWPNCLAARSAKSTKC